jgi:thiamine-phosphate pyrophosphorylase
MSRRQTALPRCWLMTDERLGDGLWTALKRLPRGAGVVVRHYSLAPGERLALARSVVAFGRSRGLVVAVAGDERLARRAGAAIVHNPDRRRTLLIRSFAVHDSSQLRRAAARGASALFVSPVFPTRSHPGARPLGTMRTAALVRLAGRMPVFGLGGMTVQRFEAWRGLGLAGWAGIDAWSSKSLQNAHPE